MSIFQACDIRGVVGNDLNVALADRIGRSLGRMMHARGETHVCVGGDFRRSTPALKRGLVNGLVEAGAHVCDVGLVPTPVVQFAARKLGISNAAVVTASHNPGRYNGVKFQVGGWPAVPELVRELKEGLDGVIHSPGTGSREQRDMLPDYERQIMAQAGDLGGTAAQPLTVALDTMDGAFTQIAPGILESAGHRVESLCEQVDPDFASRDPNPAADINLLALIERVTQDGADVGVALDGDGDRVILVDHTGRIVRPEQLGAVLVRHCFDRPTVVYDLKCASVLPRAVESAGGTAVMRPSGYGFIKTTVIQQRAEMGVEASGHHFFQALAGGDDGLFTALVLLNLLGQKQTRLADLIDPIGWPAITSDIRIPFAGDAAAAIERIADRCGGRVLRLDGVRAEYAGGWALARPSITEPAITLRFEGHDRDHVLAIARQFLAATPQILEKVLEKIDE